MNNLTLKEAKKRKKIIKDVDYNIFINICSSKDFYTKTIVNFTAVKNKTTFIENICKKLISAKLNNIDIKNYNSEKIILKNLKEKNTLIIEGIYNYSRSGEGFHQSFDNVDNERYLYTHFSNAYAKYVFACFDQPDIKASFTISVKGPKNWIIKSNYPEKATKKNTNTKIVNFKTTAKISTYLVEIFAGPYVGKKQTHKLKSGKIIPIGIYARKSLEKYVDYNGMFNDTKNGFDFFSKKLRIDYPYPKYDQVFVPEFNAGAMENVGAVTFTEHFLYRSKPTESMLDIRSMVIWHEMSHMWFGNLVTLKWWNDIWLNEAFANYMGFFALANIRKNENKWLAFTTREKQLAYDEDQLPSTHPIMLPVKSVQDSELNYDLITYAKGASLLIQLSHYIGQNKFLEAIHNYLKTYSFSNAEFNDILNELKKITKKNLSNWKNKWLLSKGVTEIYYNNDSHIIQRPAHFSNKVIRPLTLNVKGYKFSNNKLIQNYSNNIDIKKTKTNYKPPLKSDLILLNADDNNYIKILYKKETIKFLQKNICKINDKFARSIVWAGLWEACRDGIIPVSDFIDLTLSSLEDKNENISMLITTNINHIIYALSNYLTNHKNLYEQVANSAQKIYMENKNNTNYKTAAISLLSKCGIDKNSVTFIKKLLNNKNTTIEEKWKLILPLSKSNQCTKTMLNSLLKQDKSDLSKEYYFTCLASIPNAKAKLESWKKITSNKLSNFELRSVMAGFMNCDDEKLLIPYVKKYFLYLNKIWEKGTFETKNSYTRIMYPKYGNEKTVKLTRNFLKNSKNSAMNRILKDCLENLKRSIKIKNKKFNQI